MFLLYAKYSLAHTFDDRRHFRCGLRDQSTNIRSTVDIFIITSAIYLRGLALNGVFARLNQSFNFRLLTNFDQSLNHYRPIS